MGPVCARDEDCKHLKKLSVPNFEVEHRKMTALDLSSCSECRRIHTTPADSRKMFTCLVCAYLHCNVPLDNDTTSHSARHFLQNTSHFMCMDNLKHVYCFKCRNYVCLTTLSKESEAAYTDLCRIMDSYPSTVPAPLPATKTKALPEAEPELAPRLATSETVLERAAKPAQAEDGTEVITQPAAPASPMPVPAAEKAEPVKPAAPLPVPVATTPRKLSPKPVPASPIMLPSPAEEEAKDEVSGVNHLIVPATTPKAGLKELNEQHLSMRKSPSPILRTPAPEGRATVSHYYDTVLLSPLPNERSSVYVKSEKLMYVSPTSGAGESPAPDKPIVVRGLKAHEAENLSYVNPVMQCLFASKALVYHYTKSINPVLINSPFNQELREFFKTYLAGEGAFDALPFVEPALANGHKNFNYKANKDPMNALVHIFEALISSQCRVIREKLGKPSTKINTSAALIGKLLTTEICSAMTCTKCGNSRWEAHEIQNFKVTYPPPLSGDEVAKGPLKYRSDTIKGVPCYVPCNVSLEPKNDVASLFLAHFKSALKTQTECKHCGDKQEFVLDHYIKHEPNILIIQIYREMETAEKIVPSRSLHLDDVLIMDQPTLSDQRLEEKIKTMGAKELALNWCGYKLYAMIAAKTKDILTGKDYYPTYVKHGEKYLI